MVVTPVDRHRFDSVLALPQCRPPMIKTGILCGAAVLAGSVSGANDLVRTVVTETRSLA
jgi:hypothetical protein